MKKKLFLLGLVIFFTVVSVTNAFAQCSICKKTALQMGEETAKGLNAGIFYLAVIPFIIAGYIFYRWRKT